MQTRPHALALLAAGILSVTTANGNQQERAPTSRRNCCAVLELRQYTLKPGRRDALIALFDRYFVEPQEMVGMTIVGQFRDRRRSERFVWIRGFSDMQSRHAALEQFYGGPVWAEHKVAANDTMLASDDVRLLKPARPSTAVLVTESAPNTFTRLPVREGEHLMVWFGTLQGIAVLSAERLEKASAALGPPADGPLEVLELDPTPRSLLGHHRATR